MKKSLKLILSTSLALLLCAMMFTACNHTHEYEWETVKNPTCIEEGERRATCSCGTRRTESIDALKHEEIDAESKLPTAITTGYKNGTICKNCNATIKEPTTLYSLRDYVLKNPTAIEDGKYILYLTASDLIPTTEMEGVFQINYLSSTSTIEIIFTAFPNYFTQNDTSVYYAESITLHETNTSVLRYQFGYQFQLGNNSYWDEMHGQFNIADIYNLTELTYYDTSSTIGGSTEYQKQRFDAYKATACEMAQSIADLLSAFLEKENFGYGIEAFGFIPS